MAEIPQPARTKALYAQRIRDFNSGRKIKKTDRQAWNSVLAKSSKRDYDDWVARWVDRIEEANVQGDPKAISQGVKVLSGKTKKQFTP